MSGLFRKTLTDELRSIIMACVVCHQPLEQAQEICPDCVQLLCKTSRLFDTDLQLFSRDWHKMRVLGAYQGLLATLISQGKFSARPELLIHLTRIFANHLRQTDPSARLPMISVPMSIWRKLYRGYNQADIIVEQLSRVLDNPIISGVIKHSGSLRTQHKLTKIQRHAQSRQRYVLQGRVPRRVVVVDDVITTGATMSTICRQLKAAGAEYIEVWALALTCK